MIRMGILWVFHIFIGRRHDMNNSFYINQADFTDALSIALELSSIGIVAHHRRTAVISAHIGLEMNLSHADLETLVNAAMLHDIGAAANWQEKHFVTHLEEDHEVFHHAENGYKILMQSDKLQKMALPIRYHHDRYDGHNPSGLVGDEIPLLSRILHTADRVEVQVRNNIHILKQRTRIIEHFQNNPLFDPKVVAALNSLAKKDFFWFDISTPYSFEMIRAKNNIISSDRFNVNDLINLSEIFSMVIDGTSPYTCAHSRNNAKVSEYLSLKVGFSENESKMMYLAGLLHDLGKLGIPNDIIDKPGELTSEEFDQIKQHPYYSYIILAKIPGFTCIAEWAGFHHEKLDGSGYPFGLKAASIPLGSRILAVADIFTALLESRPYRVSMRPAEALRVIWNMTDNGLIDRTVVSKLDENLDEMLTLITRD